MEQASAKERFFTRCRECGIGLAFEEWSRGLERCAPCLRVPAAAGPAATYVRRRPPAIPVEDEETRYLRLLDGLPDELIDELVAALEAEATSCEEAAAGVPSAPGPVQEVLAEIGFGRSPHELAWSAWGFAGGFALNVAVAKYAQMQSGASMGSFLGPLLLGGLLAGATCAAIGWGLARLRDRSA